MSPIKLEEVQNQLDELEVKDFIRPNTSCWGAPKLLTEKKLEIRDCALIIESWTRSLSRIDTHYWELMIFFINVEVKVFSKLDLKLEYHQVKMKESDMPIASFKTSMDIMNSLWYHIVWQMHWLFSWIWWIEFLPLTWISLL